MSHKYTIKDGAFFISDAHESEYKRREFGKFLDAINDGRLNPTQLFLMGDMFDILIGRDKFCTNLWDEYIKKIDEISKKIDVYYFEGNHDFDLKIIFKNTDVISIKNQPLYFGSKDKTIALSHGDSFEGFSYKIYTSLIRSKIVLNVLSLFQKVSNHKITRGLSSRLEKKNICMKIENFKEIVEKRIDKYSTCDIVAEGHFHQNKIFDFNGVRYINFASFACEGIYYIFSHKDKIEFTPVKFSL